MAKQAIFFVFLMIACLMFVNINAQAIYDSEGKLCLCPTTDDLRRVCGSDGKTYVNKSFLDCENKCKRSNIELKYEGQCKEAAQN